MGKSMRLRLGILLAFCLTLGELPLNTLTVYTTVTSRDPITVTVVCLFVRTLGHCRGRNTTNSSKL